MFVDRDDDGDPEPPTIEKMERLGDSKANGFEGESGFGGVVGPENP